MKLQLASDLHLDHFTHDFPGERLISPVVGADALVLAGDISKGTRAIDLFKDWPVPVYYLAGNHEFYGCVFEETRADLKKAAQGTCITFLDDTAIITSGVRFLGATLWTDYRLNLNRTQRQLMEIAETRINDHFHIQCADGRFSAAHALAAHETSRAWLERELLKPFEGKTVVLTHHAPHPLSVHPQYIGDFVNAAFVSNLSELLPHADLWIHGHTHNSFDYSVLGCRVVANPSGYVRNLRSARSPAKFQFENLEWNPSLVLEV
jgi:predicted phosphodiesterase